MSDKFWDSFFTNFPAMIVGMATFLSVIVTNHRLGKVHKQINSRMDQLLKTTAESAKALGIKEESERLK